MITHTQHAMYRGFMTFQTLILNCLSFCSYRSNCRSNRITHILNTFKHQFSISMQHLLYFFLFNLFIKLFLFYFVLSQNFRWLMIQLMIKTIIPFCRLLLYWQSRKRMFSFLNTITTFLSYSSFLSSLTSNFIYYKFIIWFNENSIW